MTTDNPIAKHLKEYHCGELRVVPSRELEAAFRFADLTFAARSIACAGMASQFAALIPAILRRHRGGTAEDDPAAPKQDQEDRHAERGLTKALEQFTDSGQISLPLEGGDTA